VRVGQVGVTDEFVEDDAFAQNISDGEAIRSRNAHQPGEGRIDPAEEILEGDRRGDAKPALHRRQAPIGESDD